MLNLLQHLSVDLQPQRFSMLAKNTCGCYLSRIVFAFLLLISLGNEKLLLSTVVPMMNVSFNIPPGIYDCDSHGDLS